MPRQGGQTPRIKFNFAKYIFFWTSLPYFINRMSLVPQRKFLLGDSLFDQSEANEVRFPPKKSNYIFFVFLVKTGPACVTD